MTDGFYLLFFFKAVDILGERDEKKSIDGNLTLKVANRSKPPCCYNAKGNGKQVSKQERNANLTSYITSYFLH